MIRIGATVLLNEEPDCIVPAGRCTVSRVNKDGSTNSVLSIGWEDNL